MRRPVVRLSRSGVRGRVVSRARVVEKRGGGANVNGIAAPSFATSVEQWRTRTRDLLDAVQRRRRSPRRGAATTSPTERRHLRRSATYLLDEDEASPRRAAATISDDRSSSSISDDAIDDAAIDEERHRDLHLRVLDVDRLDGRLLEDGQRAGRRRRSRRGRSRTRRTPSNVAAKNAIMIAADGPSLGSFPTANGTSGHFDGENFSPLRGVF